MAAGRSWRTTRYRPCHRWLSASSAGGQHPSHPGILDDMPVTSGGGDRSLAADLVHDPLRGPPVTFYEHVESKAAAHLRRAGGGEADLAIDNTVCGTNDRDQAYPWTCDNILPAILPAGSRLRVWVTRDGGHLVARCLHRHRRKDQPMTPLLRDYHGHPYDLTSLDEAGSRFDGQITAITPHGERGQTLTIGTADRPVLRIDVDADADRAALRWLPDGSHATGLDADTPITVYESPDTGLRDIPAGLAWVNTATARNAVIEYVTSGQRPTSVTWVHDELPAT
ncbi:Imm1 family immunity protein [Micromonospora haikouensis]|uniref:Imm1 family immunity protein n=1 Tax=Micromonospora haikouensis TaxID=686309 RepID=UPI00379BF8F7